MNKWLDDIEELERLNTFCTGKAISCIEYEADIFTMRFADGSRVRLSTLGGLEIAEFVDKPIQFTPWELKRNDLYSDINERTDSHEPDNH